MAKYLAEDDDCDEDCDDALTMRGKSTTDLRLAEERELLKLLSKKSNSTRNDQALLSLLQASDSEDESEVPSELANWRENDFNVSRTFYAKDAKKKNRHSIDKKLIELLK